MKLFALCSMFIVWGGYLWTAEYAKTTPNGKEIYLARMQRDIAESTEKVALAKAKIRMKELELQQDGCINK